MQQKNASRQIFFHRAKLSVRFRPLGSGFRLCSSDPTPARPLAQMKRLLATRRGSAAEIPVSMLRCVPGLSVGKNRRVQLSLSA